MTGRSPGDRPGAGRRTSPAWRRILRALLRYGLPTLGVFVIGRAVLASIGGDIERWRFALGVLLIVASFSARLVPR